MFEPHNRGQESAGIVTCKWTHEPMSVHRGMGLVSQVFNEPVMMSLKGNLGIGHTRYSTMGGATDIQLIQPFQVHTSYGTIAVAHNGELVNSQRLRERILANGVGLSTLSDSELIPHALAMDPPEQFKKDYINRKFKGKNGLTNGQDKTNDIEDSHFAGNSHRNIGYATQLSEKEANFVARIIHVSLNLSHLEYNSNHNCLL